MRLVEGRGWERRQRHLRKIIVVQPYILRKRPLQIVATEELGGRDRSHFHIDSGRGDLFSQHLRCLNRSLNDIGGNDLER